MRSETYKKHTKSYHTILGCPLYRSRAGSIGSQKSKITKGIASLSYTGYYYFMSWAGNQGTSEALANENKK